MDRANFLAAIREDPDDDSPRLVYADYLEENGELGRAEFIRLQCELASAGTHDRSVQRRVRELLSSNKQQWLAPLEGLAIEAGLSRGFVEHVTYATGSVERSPDEIAAVSRVEAVRHLRDSSQLLNSWPLIEALPRLGHLESLEIWNYTVPYEDEQLRGLVGTPHLANLRRLVVRFERGRAFSSETLIDGLTSPHWDGLRELSVRGDVWDETLPNDVIAEVATGGRFRLRLWDLAGTRMDVATARAFVESPVVRDAALIDLGEIRVTAEAMAILVEALATFRSLRWLRLAGAEIADAAGRRSHMLADDAVLSPLIADRFADGVVSVEDEYITPWNLPTRPDACFWPAVPRSTRNRPFSNREKVVCRLR